MRRTFLATSLLAAALAFGSLPALAGVSADVNVRVGHRGEAFDSRAPRGDWQSGRGGDGHADGQWHKGGCSRNGARMHRSGGQFGSSRWNNGGRGTSGWNRDHSGRGRVDSPGYGRNGGNDRNDRNDN